MSAAPDRFHVLGLPVDVLSLEAAVDRVGDRLMAPQSGEKPLHIVTMNAEMAMQAQQDEALGGIIRSAGLVVPDGSGVVWAVRRQAGAPRVAKVAGVELVKALAARAATTGWRVYMLGGKPGVAEEAATALQAVHPGLVVAGARDGYFQPDEDEAVQDAIRAARPDILLVALGVPRQEKWIAANQVRLGVPVAMGVGGSLDVFAGRVRRAPTAFQRLHLEWLFRLLQEPWRIERMRSTLPTFVKEVIVRPEGVVTPEVRS